MEKNNFFMNFYFPTRGEVQTAIKLEGGGVKALMEWMINRLSDE